jgi:hypothetical protein
MSLSLGLSPCGNYDIFYVFVECYVSVRFCVGFSSKPSLIYGGFGLIISGGVGCGLVLNYDGSFLGLMVFLVYSGSIIVVFGCSILSMLPVLGLLPLSKFCLNPPKAENHPPNRSLVSHPFQVWTGTWASFLIPSVIPPVIFPSSSVCKQQLLRLNFPQTPPSEVSK